MEPELCLGLFAVRTISDGAERCNAVGGMRSDLDNGQEGDGQPEAVFGERRKPFELRSLDGGAWRLLA